MKHKEPDLTSAARLLIHLDFPGLFPQAVMYSLVDADPRLAFPAAIDSLRKAQPAHAHSSAADASLAGAAWDELSAQTEGSRMLLAVPKDPPTQTGGDTFLVHLSAVVISSSGPATTRQKWLLSRTCMFLDKPVAWCVPISLAPGTTQTITLSQDNATDLETLATH